MTFNQNIQKSFSHNIQKDISKISKMSNRKELLLRLPEDLFSVMKDFKNTSGISYTNQIYNAIVWYYFQQGLLDLGWIKRKHSKNGNNRKEKVKVQVMDESLKFCDGDKCEIPVQLPPFSKNC